MYSVQGYLLLDLGTVFMGMVMGISLAAVVAFFFLSMSFNKDIRKLKKTNNIQNSMYIKYTDEAIKKFKDKEYLKNEKQMKRFIETNRKAMLNIAYYHNGNKNNPIHQLTTMQLFELDNAISTKVEQIFNTKTLRIIKKVKIEDVYRVRNASTNILQNDIVKTVVEKDIQKHVSRVLYVINFINPLYYARKLVISRIFKKAIDGIYISIIEMICYETNSFYTKKNS